MGLRLIVTFQRQEGFLVRKSCPQLDYGDIPEVLKSGYLGSKIQVSACPTIETLSFGTLRWDPEEL